MAKSQRDIKKTLDPKKVEYMVITNRTKQLIGIQLVEPDGVDFFHGQQTIRLMGKQSARFPVDRLMESQVNNLRKKGMIAVSGYSEW